MSLLLAFIIHVFHIIVITFIILTPFFINIPSYLVLHVTSCISLLVHWWGNNDSCSLTLMESTLEVSLQKTH